MSTELPTLKIVVSELDEFKQLMHQIRHLVEIIDNPYQSPQVKENALEELKEAIK